VLPHDGEGIEDRARSILQPGFQHCYPFGVQDTLSVGAFQDIPFIACRERTQRRRRLIPEDRDDDEKQEAGSPKSKQIFPAVPGHAEADSHISSPE
jgi:hypothetical protein